MSFASTLLSGVPYEPSRAPYLLLATPTYTEGPRLYYRDVRFEFTLNVKLFIHSTVYCDLLSLHETFHLKKYFLYCHLIIIKWKICNLKFDYAPFIFRGLKFSSYDNGSLPSVSPTTNSYQEKTFTSRSQLPERYSFQLLRTIVFDVFSFKLLIFFLWSYINLLLEIYVIISKNLYIRRILFWIYPYTVKVCDKYNILYIINIILKYESIFIYIIHNIFFCLLKRYYFKWFWDDFNNDVV